MSNKKEGIEKDEFNINTPVVGSLIKKDKLNISKNISTTEYTNNDVKILEEEVYTGCLDQIIERDFFPHLKRMREQRDELGLFLENEEDIDIPDEEAQNEINQVLKNDKMGLDSFFNNFTSEDNQSFKEILKKDNMQRKEKYKWLYLGEKKALQEKETRLIENSGLVSDSRELILRNDDNKQLISIKKDKIANKIAKINELEDFSIDDKINERVYKKVETWKYTGKNSLMYVPDGQYNKNITELQTRAKPKAIAYENTRLENIQNQTVPSTPSTSISGLINSNKGNASNSQLNELVEATPAPNPTSLGAENPMAWGFLGSTPVRLGTVETPSTPGFKMQSLNSREKLGMKLAGNARKNLAQKERMMQGRTPHLTKKGEQNLGLSPAANRLLNSLSGSKKGSIFPKSKLASDISRFTTPATKLRNTNNTPNFKSFIARPKEKGDKE